jgi:hypothetical protein
MEGEENTGTEGTSTTEENTPEASPPGETAKQRERRILEATVNGRKVKVDEQTLLKDYSKYTAADEKFREAADIRKRNEDFERRIVDDPEAFLNDERIPKAKRREIAERILMRELEEEMAPEKSAAELRFEEMQRELARYKEKETEEKTASEQAEFAKIVDHRREEIAKTFQEAIAISPLSKEQGTSAEVVREMATYMRLCKQAGYDVSPKELADHVEQRFMNSYKALTSSMEGEDLIGFLGQDIVKKIRMHDLKQLEARRGAREPDTAQNWTQTKTRQRDITDPRDLMRRK